MPLAVKRGYTKVYTSKKKITGKPTKVLSPSKIGYYGRSITDLNRDELISALTELAKLYEDLKRKLEYKD